MVFTVPTDWVVRHYCEFISKACVRNNADIGTGDVSSSDESLVTLHHPTPFLSCPTSEPPTESLPLPTTCSRPESESTHRPRTSTSSSLGLMVDLHPLARARASLLPQLVVALPPRPLLPRARPPRRATGPLLNLRLSDTPTQRPRRRVRPRASTPWRRSPSTTRRRTAGS